MPKKIQPNRPPEVPYPGKFPEVYPDEIPEPIAPEEESDIIPDDEDTFETPPYEAPPPAEGP